MKLATKVKVPVQKAPAQDEPKETPAENLVSKAAKKAIQKAGDDLEKAVSAFERSVRKNQDLRDALLEPLVHEACYTVVSRQFRSERRSIWDRAQHTSAPVAQGEDQAQRVVHLAIGTLLMFPLPGGMRLGDATRGEIETAAQFYHSQATNMAVKGRWLDLVAKAVPKGKTAGEVLDDERLKALQKQAQEA